MKGVCKMKLKQASYKNGRGYSGYHTGYHNQKVYCRSLLEKIYCMILDDQQILYFMEKQTYIINGYSYKPDFFIYDKSNNLKKIIEIKGSNEEKKTYLKRFKYFFDISNIDFEVIVIDKRKYFKKES